MTDIKFHPKAFSMVWDDEPWQPWRKDARVTRVSFESSGHLDIWLDDGSHAIIDAPLGGVVHIAIKSTHQLVVRKNPSGKEE